MLKNSLLNQGAFPNSTNNNNKCFDLILGCGSDGELFSISPCCWMLSILTAFSQIYSTSHVEVSDHFVERVSLKFNFLQWKLLSEHNIFPTWKSYSRETSGGARGGILMELVILVSIHFWRFSGSVQV